MLPDVNEFPAQGCTYGGSERWKLGGHSALGISVASITVKIWRASNVIFQCPVSSFVSVTVQDFWSLD